VRGSPCAHWLQIFEPPLGSSGLEIGEPSAGEIEKDDGQSPNQIEQGQASDDDRIRDNHDLEGDADEQ
jgi:hypothetical protein